MNKKEWTLVFALRIDKLIIDQVGVLAAESWHNHIILRNIGQYGMVKMVVLRTQIKF